MEEIIIYIAGLIAGILSVLLVYYYNKYTEVLEENSSLTKENNSLSTKLLRKKRYDRKASLVWDDWHIKDNTNYKWSVTLYMNVIALSETNPNLYHFEIESIYSQNPNDPWSVKEYSDYFKKETNGGWFDISTINSKYKFNWITNQSKEEIRDSKLEELGL